MLLTTNNGRWKKRNRCGAAVVELAVFAPILVAFCFGSLELTFYIFLKQSLATAAYESARNAASPAGTASSATEEGTRIFDERRIVGASLNFSMPPESSTPGQILTVTVSAPMSQNTYLRTGLFSPKTVAVSASMVRE